MGVNGPVDTMIRETAIEKSRIVFDKHPPRVTFADACRAGQFDAGVAVKIAGHGEELQHGADR
jgi:hypothetical protein